MKKKDDSGKWEIQSPHKLFDYIREMYNIKSDSQLAHMLSSRTPLISRIRTGAMRMTPALMIAIHEQTKLPIEKIKEMSK